MKDPAALYFNCLLGQGVSVSLQGELYTESVSFTLDATVSKPIQLTFTLPNGSSHEERYTFCPSSANILLLHTDRSLGSVDDMHGDPTHQTYCYGNLAYFGEESGQDFTASFSIRGRGNATWEDEKKGYALSLFADDSYQAPLKQSISAMGRSEDWVLIANHRDRTLLRNALAQTLAARLGMPYTVRYVFADLYLDGQYVGLYNLMQKVETGREQVDIPRAQFDSLEGGYLLEFDNYSDTPQIRLQKSGMRVTVNSPDTLDSYKAITDLLNQAEAAIFAADGRNPATGLYWYDYIDIASFAALWVVREYTMDNDATVNFRFYYDPADGKFHGGPAWDFDNSMARNTGIFKEPESALIESGYRNPDCWLRKLMAFDRFRLAIVELYRSHTPLFDSDSEDSIYALAHRLRDRLSYSIEQNFTVWADQLTAQRWNYPKERTYQGHFAILTDFLSRRNAFWRTYIPALVG